MSSKDKELSDLYEKLQALRISISLLENRVELKDNTRNSFEKLRLQLNNTSSIIWIEIHNLM